ncbi:MAG: glycosyltransferase family 4 protein [Thaumarchaeota archaeon]|nr:glycosyltransferase family 4 protein [Nitrososphaerota archaeon]
MSPSFYPMIGGVEKYVQGMGTELVKLGIDVDVYTPDKVLGRRCGPPEDTIEGIRIHRIKVPFEASYRIKIWPGLGKALRRRPHSLIHVYSHDSYAIYALLAARKMGIPLAITTYGPFETHSDYDAFRRGAFRLYDAVATPRIIGGANAVFVRYPDLARWAESLGASTDRIFLEPSGIPKECLVPRSPDKFRGSIPGSPIILYLGRISPQKGVQFAVESMAGIIKAFPDAKLVLIGPDYIGYSKHLKARASELGVSDAVILMNPIQDEEAQLEAISACDIFVMPSSFEGFSQSVMKAMAQGKPVAVTNVGGLPYEVDNGKCGRIFEYGNPESMSSCVTSLLQDSTTATNMKERGRVRAQSFTFDTLARRLAEHYDSMVN